MVRLMGSLETRLYNKIFQKAMEDKNFAKNLMSVSLNGDNVALNRELEKLGVPRSALIGRVDRTARQQLYDQMYEEQPVAVPGMAEAPVVSRETAASMLRALPPAPPTTGLALLKENAALPVGPPPNLQRTRDIPLMYPALFPNDPISGLLEQRRQQVQQGQPMQPMQPLPQQ